MARDLAAARTEADERKRAEEMLRQAAERSQEHVARMTSESPTVGTLVSLSMAMGQFDEHRLLAGERTRDAESVLDTCHGALTAAAQARQMLDKLRERHETASRADDNARDRRSMDSIALTRFTHEVRINTPERIRTTR
jgi:flagellar export protein FliJ